MKETRIDQLNAMISDAIEKDAKYFGVSINIGLTHNEVIINTMDNMLEGKIKYYMSAYTDDLKLKYSESIQITAFAFGNNFEEIKRKLLG